MKEFLTMDLVAIHKYVIQGTHFNMMDHADNVASTSELNQVVQAVARICVRIEQDMSSPLRVSAVCVQEARPQLTRERASKRAALGMKSSMAQDAYGVATIKDLSMEYANSVPARPQRGCSLMVDVIRAYRTREL